MSIMLTPVHHDLTYLEPLSPGRARRFVWHLIGAPLGTVLDLGCGWAELLLEAVEQAPGSTTTTPADRRHRNAPTAPAGRFVHRWPTALGVAVAAAAAYDLTDGAGLSVTIALPVLVYLAAAALQRPSASWVVFAAALGAVAAMKVLAVEPVLGLAGATAVCLLVGAVRGLLGTGALFRVQSAGALGFGGIAVAALYVDPTMGGFLVSAGLIGHGTWDVIHHRRDIVVARSVSEFCAVLDFILGGVILVFMFATIS